MKRENELHGWHKRVESSGNISESEKIVGDLVARAKDADLYYLPPEKRIQHTLADFKEFEKAILSLEKGEADAINSDPDLKAQIASVQSIMERDLEIKKMEEDFKAAGFDPRPSGPKEGVTSSDLAEELLRLQYVEVRLYSVLNKSSIRLRDVLWTDAFKKGDAYTSEYMDAREKKSHGLSVRGSAKLVALTDTEQILVKIKDKLIYDKSALEELEIMKELEELEKSEMPE